MESDPQKGEVYLDCLHYLYVKACPQHRSAQKLSQNALRAPHSASTAEVAGSKGGQANLRHSSRSSPDPAGHNSNPNPPLTQASQSGSHKPTAKTPNTPKSQCNFFGFDGVQLSKKYLSSHLTKDQGCTGKAKSAESTQKYPKAPKEILTKLATLENKKGRGGGPSPPTRKGVGVQWAQGVSGIPLQPCTALEIQTQCNIQTSCSIFTTTLIICTHWCKSL